MAKHDTFPEVSLAAMLCHVTWGLFDHRWFDLLSLAVLLR
jgi:hypothetical protein